MEYETRVVSTFKLINKAMMLFEDRNDGITVEQVTYSK